MGGEGGGKQVSERGTFIVDAVLLRVRTCTQKKSGEGFGKGEGYQDWRLLNLQVRAFHTAFHTNRYKWVSLKRGTSSVFLNLLTRLDRC